MQVVKVISDQEITCFATKALRFIVHTMHLYYFFLDNESSTRLGVLKKNQLNLLAIS